MFSFNHVTISVDNLDKTLEFYKKFGFEKYKEYSDENVDIVMLKLGNMILEIFHYQEKEKLPEHSKELAIDLKTIGNKHFGLGVKNIVEAKNFVEENKLSDSEIIMKKINKIGAKMEQKMKFEQLKEKIKKCDYCKEKFGFEPHPIFWGNQNSKIVQISQAPSKNVHQNLKPFTDMSGKTLKYEWYQIADDDFYNTDNFFIGALAHCYPGKDKNGNDKQPPKCCWTKWIEKELQILDNEIYIVIGAKAAKTFFPNEIYEELIFKDNVWNGKKTIVLPHPSPLNKKWIKDHPQFLQKRIHEIRNTIRDIIK